MIVNWFRQFPVHWAAQTEVAVQSGPTTYFGFAHGQRRYVLVDEAGTYPKPLHPRFDVCNDSVKDFSWGEEAQSNNQLAVAILCHYLEDEQEAVNLADQFREFVISKLPLNSWRLTFAEVGEAISRIRGWRAPLISRISQ